GGAEQQADRDRFWGSMELLPEVAAGLLVGGRLVQRELGQGQAAPDRRQVGQLRRRLGKEVARLLPVAQFSLGAAAEVRPRGISGLVLAQQFQVEGGGESLTFLLAAVHFLLVPEDVESGAAFTVEHLVGIGGRQGVQVDVGAVLDDQAAIRRERRIAWL